MKRKKPYLLFAFLFAFSFMVFNTADAQQASELGDNVVNVERQLKGLPQPVIDMVMDHITDFTGKEINKLARIASSSRRATSGGQASNAYTAMLRWLDLNLDANNRSALLLELEAMHNISNNQ